ncbi:hypothetical protein GTA08_BOTSDO04619 [Neofusicoccum parvum]|uniref:Uncharacterized protein n=1 Tax=Neofusicoccum parvum TaxID=310453 RepID=A0ACB5SKS7_9PEZI|nr:hypothetical protein GTA08_BOTSDO04619 [Neofusicoccum parvum]
MANEITIDDETIPYSRIKIADNPDLTIRVFEYVEGPGYSTDSGNEDDDRGTAKARATDFGVDKNVMRLHSPMLSKMLGPGGWREAGRAVVELHEDTSISTTAMQAWFLHFHGKTARLAGLEVTRKDIWSIVAAGKKYGLKSAELKTWFADWYTKSEKGKVWKVQDFQELLYPCFEFDHAPGFARASRYLAYNKHGHIMEKNPTKHRDLHLPPRTIQQINAAKGRLRIVLHRELWKPIHTLLTEAKCSCKEKTVFGYQKALVNIGVWPLEEMYLKYSLKEILDKLSKFDWAPDPDSCRYYCNMTDYAGLVAEAGRDVSKYFHGLCLVCMDMTNPKTTNVDEYYWWHNYIKDWDRKCRPHGVSHGQPTWFYSYMGRKQQTDAREAWYQANRFDL